jgi:hypothetical protein
VRRESGRRVRRESGASRPVPRRRHLSRTDLDRFDLDRMFGDASVFDLGPAFCDELTSE